MAFKKRLATFISNWFGVIIATIIVAFSATFGGMYLYARSNIYNATDFATQALDTIPGDYWMIPIDVIEDPSGVIYHISLQTYHPYNGIIVNVTISDIVIKIGNYEFIVLQDDEWTKSVTGGDSSLTIFEGNFTIDTQSLDDLKSQESVDIVIQGQISGSGKYRWVSRTAITQINILRSGGVFQ